MSPSLLFTKLYTKSCVLRNFRNFKEKHGSLVIKEFFKKKEF